MTAPQQILMDKIADILQVDAGDVTLTTVATDFPSWDSMAYVELVFMLEREYGVALPLMKAESLQSVAGVIDVLEAACKL